MARKRKSTPPGAVGSPQDLFDAAAADTDYSDQRCLQTYAAKSVIITGERKGKEAACSQEQESQTKGRLAHLWKAVRVAIGSAFLCFRSQRPQTPSSAADPAVPGTDGVTPAYALAAVTWVEPGRWQGKKVHFVRVQVSHHRSSSHYLERATIDFRFWKAGTAIQSIAAYSDRALEALKVPRAVRLSALAPSIAQFCPGTSVGRPAGTQVEPSWAGHFRTGERFRYYADVRGPSNHLAPSSRDNEVYCVLHVVTYLNTEFGTKLDETPPPFSVGLVVLSEGQPFEMTAHSTTSHHYVAPVPQYIWSPYAPVRFNSTVRHIPNGHEPLGMDFYTPEAKARWKELVPEFTPYDTVSTLIRPRQLMSRFGLGTRTEMSHLERRGVNSARSARSFVLHNHESIACRLCVAVRSTSWSFSGEGAPNAEQGSLQQMHPLSRLAGLDWR